MLRVTTQWVAFQGAPYYSTMFFDGSLSTEAQNAVTAVAQFWTTIADRINSDTDATVLGEVQVVDPATGETTAQYDVGNEAVASTAANTPLPWSTQGLVQWRTGVFLGGRQVRGRTFIPTPTEQDNDIGRPGTAYKADVDAAALTLVTGSGLVVWSRAHGQAVEVSSGACWDQWAYLGSRRD